MNCLHWKNAMALVSLMFSLALSGCVAVAAQPVSADVRHNPSQAYRAWVFCIDRSLSPREQQFGKLLGVLKGMAESKVTYNDLVWLLDIQADPGQARLFVMPQATQTRRSAPTGSAESLRRAKAELIQAIGAASQVSGRTNLKDPLEAALDILRAHQGASERILVMGSDFLTDSNSGRVSFEAPQTERAQSAAKINAFLLVTYPKPQYLRALRIGPSELLMKIEEDWKGNLYQRGALTVTVRAVDAMPMAVPQAGADMRGN